MQLHRRAVIDVGTNSVKVLVAAVSGRAVTPLLEDTATTRLGRGFYESHHLQPEAIVRTVEAIARFAARAREHGAAVAHVFATSAARDAVNQEEFRRAVRAATGLPVEIISGEQEAEWVFRGVTTDRQLEDRPLAIVDVGGGSTEIIFGEKGHAVFRQSFPLGSVRLLEELRPADPPAAADLAGCRRRLRDFFEAKVNPAVAAAWPEHDRNAVQLVGTGGTVGILARLEGRWPEYERERLEGTRLSRRQIGDWVTALWNCSLAERQQLPGLPPDRADVMLTGAAIYEAVLESLRFPELYVSTRGVRFGAMLERC